MSSITNLKVYTTHPHPCSYLEEQTATTLFVDPQADIDKHLYSRLAENGFRRSGEHLYTPHCLDCSSCIPVRVPVDEFVFNRSQKRIWARNSDLKVTEPKDITGDKYYRLYADYINQRHADGDMYPANKEQYESFLTAQWDLTRYYAFWKDGELKALSVVDLMDNGISAVYTFFDPEDKRRSLGNFCILWQIELAKTMNLPSLYLGYWIKNCAKMSYKSKFIPLELYVNRRWMQISA